MAKWEAREESVNSEIRRPDPRYLEKGLTTQCVHAGERWPEEQVWTSNTPIYRSTTYFYDRAEALDDRMFNREPGYIYTRGGNPTQSALERALSTLERADATRVCASGMAATHLALVAAGAGPERPILCSSDVYGSVFTMVQNIFPQLGAPTLLMDFTDLDRLEETMRSEKPAIVCFEVITNPMTKIIDAPAVIEMAHRHGAVAIVDSTYTTPYLFRPLEHGADYVTHSVSKYLSGHGDVLAGSVSCHLRAPVNTPSREKIDKKERGTPTAVRAPLPGNIVEVYVKQGDIVKKDQKLLLMEAMKMENVVLAETDGVIERIVVKAGDAVLQGDVLLETI